MPQYAFNGHSGSRPDTLLLVALLLGVGVVAATAALVARRRGGAEPSFEVAAPTIPPGPPAPVALAQPDPVEIELQELIAEERARELACEAERPAAPV